jgi:multiple sugar transport system substrate-binding protein
MKRLLFLLVVLSIGMLVLVGCEKKAEVSTRPEGVLTVTVGYNPNELSEAEVEAFEAKNPNTDINQIAADYNALLSAVAAGDPPELFRTEHTKIPYFVVRDLLYPIDSYIAASDQMSEDDFEFAVNTFRYDKDNYIAGEGPLYGLPKDYSVLFDFFYRKDLVEQVGLEIPSLTDPMSYAEFYDFMKALSVFDGERTIRWAYSGVLDEAPDQAIELMLAQAGKTIYADDELKEVNIVDNPEAVAVIRYIYDMCIDRLTDSPIDPAEAWLGAALAAEEPRAAIYQFGYWAGALYADVNELVGYSPSPLWGDEWLSGGHVAGTMMFAADDTYMNDEAWKFMEYYHQEEPAVARAKSGWGLPIQKSFRDMIPQATQLDKDRLEVTLAQLEGGNYYVVNGNPWALEPLKAVFTKHWGDVLNGNITFDEFLSRLETETNELILDGLNVLGEA